MPKRIPEAQQKLNWLYQQYARYNKKFWDNRLPAEVHIQIVARGTVGQSIDCREKNKYVEEGVTTTYPGTDIPPVIEIAEFVMNYIPYAKAVLIHEMIHAGGTRDHGKAFKDEIKRIAKLGALEVLLL